MSYCLSVQDKIIYEGDTIEAYTDGEKTGITKIKVVKIRPETQCFVAKIDGHTDEISIPIDLWSDFSIIEVGEVTDPNIIFRRHRARSF